MQFTVLTIFPDMFESFWGHGIIRRAIDQKNIFGSTVNIRDYAEDRHHVTDDRPYGGGNGMVMKPEPLAGAIRAASRTSPSAKTVLLTPQGKVFDQDTACKLATYESLTLVCGRYEGVDERICDDLIDIELSIGDYILTGGELAAMIVIEAVTRLIPGVLGGEDSAAKDSFSDGLLEHAHYTRPQCFEGREIPQVLRSGHHQEIENWRLESSLMRTFVKRADLLQKKALNQQELNIIKRWLHDIQNIWDDNQRGKKKTGADT